MNLTQSNTHSGQGQGQGQKLKRLKLKWCGEIFIILGMHIYLTQSHTFSVDMSVMHIDLQL